VWITSDIFAGQLPGLGDLGGLGALGDMLGSKGLEGLLGGIGGEQVSTMREFTIAHEVAHQWWHAMVGNDSITSPAFDEPLAQFSACTYWTWAHGAAAGERVCDLHINAQYKAMRQLGNEDAAADRPSAAFSSSLQYGGVVYGKAPLFYRKLSDLIGREAELAALRAFVRRHLFQQVSTDNLLAAFKEATPDKAADIDALWQRWFHEAHGDEDLGVTAGAAGGIPGLPSGVGPEELQKLIDQLLNPAKQPS
jgi:hypothetical protein